MPLPSVHLQADDLAKRFGRNVLFRGLSLSVAGGQSLAVTGPNGSGKSTLVLILAGLLTPDRGAVRLEVGGTTIEAADRPLRVGLVAPYLNVYDTLSARENLLFLARTRRLPDARARCAALLDRVGLGTRADDFVGRFSSGMKQRVKYASALLADPPVLLLDEPSTNLDAAGIHLVEELTGEHLGRGGVLIVATNVPAEAARCDATLSVSDFP